MCISSLDITCLNVQSSSSRPLSCWPGTCQRSWKRYPDRRLPTRSGLAQHPVLGFGGDALRLWAGDGSSGCWRRPGSVALPLASSSGRGSCHEYRNIFFLKAYSLGNCTWRSRRTTPKWLLQNLQWLIISTLYLSEQIWEVLCCSLSRVIIGTEPDLDVPHLSPRSGEKWLGIRVVAKEGVADWLDSSESLHVFNSRAAKRRSSCLHR